NIMGFDSAWRLAQVEWKRGHLSEARDAILDAVQRATMFEGGPQQIAQARIIEARIQLALGEKGAALAAAQEAAAKLPENGDMNVALARALAAKGDAAGAAASLIRAMHVDEGYTARLAAAGFDEKRLARGDADDV